MVCLLGLDLIDSHDKAPELTSDNTVHSIPFFNSATTSCYNQYPESSFPDDHYFQELLNHRSFESIFELEKILEMNIINNEG